MTTAEIESLLERVRKAEGPERDIDGAIEVQARRFQAYAVGLNDETRAKWQHIGAKVFDGDTGYDAERFTASVDACHALIELVLPGWLVCIDQLSGGWDASLVEYDRASKMVTDDYSAEAKTAPLALLEALLLALLHQASDKGMIDAE